MKVGGTDRGNGAAISECPFAHGIRSDGEMHHRSLGLIERRLRRRRTIEDVQNIGDDRLINPIMIAIFLARKRVHLAMDFDEWTPVLHAKLARSIAVTSDQSFALWIKIRALRHPAWHPNLAKSAS